MDCVMGLTAYCFRLLVSLIFIGGLTATAPLAAQDARPAPMDDSTPGLDQPLTDIPDFGVAWPDLDVSNDEMSADPELSEKNTVDDMESSEVDDLSQEHQTSLGPKKINPLAPPLLEFESPDIAAESRYEVAFRGLPQLLTDSFSNRFKALSALEQYQGNEANFAQIKRRAESDRKLVKRLLRIEGHYDAIIHTRFDNLDAGRGDKIAVIFEIESGPLYRFDAIELDGLQTAADDDLPRLQEIFGLQRGDIINSDEIIRSQIDLETAMSESGYPFAQTGEPELTIDHANRDGDLMINVAPGERYNFGSITMADTSLFDPEHVQLIARFNSGDLYRKSDVEDLRRALIATGLVSTIKLDPVASEDSGAVDLAVSLTPAPLRTIAGEIGYGTGEGIRTEISWEHRNFFPPEGLIRLTGVVATQEQSGSITYRRNNYRRRDNVLNGRVELSNVDRPAFAARTFLVAANIERLSNLIYHKRWSWSAGIELLASQERDVVGANMRTNRQTFFIGALPATVTYDASDDLLDPKSGFRLGARISPEASLQSGSFFYVRGQIDGSAYVPVSDRIVIAGRARLGAIVGARNNRIAPSRRLYSGGGASVRGYGYQKIGPRDVNNDPVGGRSLVEFSLEARIRLNWFGGNFGIVPFVDAGNVYTDPLPRFTGMRFGAGVGVRYYSDFGPIRIDIGTPINPQPGDSPVAVYVSLGQAF
ncbi:Outer membrane component of TAM transport system [hydrothermal vent metagenome]|uniref:Outer membrane component of TAM transport system n=1 Tax=hydrothermal vent metagenome TaxID=652676 RepID=A0A3B0SKR4_9ZZZZ